MRKLLIGRWLVLKNIIHEMKEIAKSLVEYVEECGLNKLGVYILKPLVIALWFTVFLFLFLVLSPIMVLFYKTPDNENIS